MSEFLRLPTGELASLTDGLRIGRSPECGLTIDEASVSREHALILGRPGRWFVEDLGSRNGTRVNRTRLVYARPHPLRHQDQIELGGVELVVLSEAALADVDRTSSLAVEYESRAVGLSFFQHQVVTCLAAPWLTGGEPASNAVIAEQLGTPDAVGAVKAALRRVYGKTGLTDDNARTKRQELCLFAQRAGWL